MIQVYLLNMNRELNEGERQQSLDILTPERKAKALRFRRFKDQNRSIATGLLEAYALLQTLGSSKSAYLIEKGPEGKPYLKDYPEIHYNISHAGNWIVCGIGDQPLGIDVESADKYTERVVTRFFQTEEAEDILLEQNIEVRKEIFAEYWVMKESFMKLSGGGFSIPLKSFYSNRKTGEIRLGNSIPKEWQEVLKDMGVKNQRNPVCQFLPLETGYRCAVCTVGKAKVEKHPVTWEELISIHHRSE